MKTLISNIKTEFKHVAKEKGLILNTFLDNDLPDAIVTDIQRLEQIIRNLLSNAFKFTEKGSVTVGISRVKPETQLNQRHS